VPPSLPLLALVLAAGLIAGFVNVLAGGGSFLTLAALELAGLPLGLANGTNRLGIVVQNAVGLVGFHTTGVVTRSSALHFALPAVLGAAAGALLVIRLPEVVFHRILAVMILVILAALLFDVEKRIRARAVPLTPLRRWLSYPVFFGIGIYIGAIQAGVGFFIMAALVLIAREDLVRTNAIKVLVIGLATLVALAIFVIQGQVDWLVGIVLSVGNGAGAWIASRLAVKKGETFVKVVLAVMLVVVAVQYLKVIPGF
jgi:uncharacterized membrane protein YfcA